MKEEHSPYLRLIQKTGFTRHPGGFSATDTLLRRAELKRDSHVLDVGCGAGHTMAHMAKTYDCSTTGVDFSGDALDRAKALYEKEPFFKNWHLVEASVEDLPFASDTFDLVLCESVLIFVKDKEKALKEMARVTKPGGYVALNELCASDRSEIIEFFARPEFGGYLALAEELKKPLEKDFSMILYDEKSFNLKEQLWAIQQWGSMQGILQMLEGFHQILTDSTSRADALKIAKLSLSLPKEVLNHLNWLLLLMQKN